MGGVGFAPDGAGRVNRCPGALAPNERTRATASKLKRGATRHYLYVILIADEVKPVLQLDRSVYQSFSQSIDHTVCGARRNRNLQPGRLDQCRFDQADGRTAAGQNDTTIMHVTAQLRR